MDSPLFLNSPLKAFGFLNFSTSSSVNYSAFSFFRIKKSQKFNKSGIAVNCLNPRNPNLLWGNYGSPIKPVSYLIPFFHKVKDFAMKSPKQNWTSVFQNFSVKETGVLQNGSFGMALMCVTSTAKVKISPFVATLAANPTFVSGIFAWAIAQSMKIFLNFCVERKWDFRIMFASGGMPSSHSALCTALTTSVAICHGVADSLFPVCLGFSLIVMYDAIGVRRHAGMQAEVLNLIVEDLFQGHPISQRKLKELLGHTPSQVLAGALLGIVVACICCQGCSIAV
ncbi:Acid phosphatase/vanadium-dependent haloperoxidase-related protein [Forsythia ovata]|uniref:Acid phosphatase/vanadium-dependent haloperoxidase-related protein n=1 Tax=Forsythia ovata TaxID=205694 RepID=A0ABD1PYC9_9LAMI